MPNLHSIYIKDKLYILLMSEEEPSKVIQVLLEEHYKKRLKAK